MGFVHVGPRFNELLFKILVDHSVQSGRCRNGQNPVLCALFPLIDIRAIYIGEGGPCGGVWGSFRIDVVMVPNRFRVGKAQPSFLLTEGSDMMSAGCGARLGSSFVVGVIMSGVVGLVVTNFCS